MQIITQGAATRPGGLVSQDKTRNSSNRRRPNVVVHGTGGDNRDLQRLESFFGADSPYVARRHHRDNRWVDSEEVVTSRPGQSDVPEQSVSANVAISESPASSSSRLLSQPAQFPAIDTEKLLEAPTAALERLTQLTSQQLSNLQNASQQAGEILNDLKGTAEAGAGSLLSNLENTQRQLAPEVQNQVEKIGTVLEKQVNEVQDVLMQAVEAIKQQAETLAVASKQKVTTAQSPPKQQQQTQQKSTKTPSTNTNATSLENNSSDLALRFKTEMQRLVEQVQSLSEVQLIKAQEVLGSVQKDLVEQSQQLRSFIAEKKVEINQTIGQQVKKSSSSSTPVVAAAQKQPQQQQQAVKKTAGVTSTNKTSTSQQKQKHTVSSSVPSSSAPVQQLTKTAESAKEMWHGNVSKLKNKIKDLPSISVPTPIANFDASKIKLAAAENPQTVALGAGVLAVTALGLFLRSRAGRKVETEQDAIKRAKSRRALDRQRNRFKQALGSDEEGSGGVDSSVFAAVQRIQSLKPAATAAAGVVAGNATNIENDDENDDEEDDGGALGIDPDSWDPAMKKEWNAFVKNSKLKDAALWDPNEVDEGLPEIYVDLERD